MEKKNNTVYYKNIKVFVGNTLIINIENKTTHKKEYKKEEMC